MGQQIDRQLLPAGWLWKWPLCRCRDDNVNYRDEFGGTPLVAACVLGVTEAARVLLDHGAQIDLPDEDGCTPLWFAASHGEINCLKLLLEYGAAVQPLTGPSSPLHAAAAAGHLQCVSVLLRHGTPVNSNHSDYRNCTPLHLVCSGSFLPSLGFAQSSRRQNLLHVAQLLLWAGANPNSFDSEGETPMIYAAKRLKSSILLDVILLLLSHGAVLRGKRKTRERFSHYLRKSHLPSDALIELLAFEHDGPVRPLQLLCLLRVRSCLDCCDLDRQLASVSLPGTLKRVVVNPLRFYHEK